MPLPDSVKDVLLRSLFVFLGAGLGGNARYWLSGLISQRTTAAFPWGTFLVNASGSLLIGFISGLLVNMKDPAGWRLFLVIGVLGGYTTFSSFSQETLNLLQSRNYSYALANVFGSCFLGLFCAWIGLVLSRLITRG